jgi:rubrerythrin
MPLTNFGAILNFAETLEKDAMAFYSQAASLDAAESYRILFEMFAKEGKKNISLVQRTRRENVTEMILEPIRDFARSSYETNVPGAKTLDLAGVLATATALENRAVRYYTDAAGKIRALPEVAHALKTLAKKRAKRVDQLQRLAST